MDPRISMEKVRFMSEGSVIEGILYKPKNFNPLHKYPAMVMIESATEHGPVTRTSGEKLAGSGFVAFAVQYRSCGERAGGLFPTEDPALNLTDIESAISYLLNLPYVSTAGMLGVGAPGGNVAYCTDI